MKDPFITANATKDPFITAKVTKGSFITLGALRAVRGQRGL